MEPEGSLPHSQVSATCTYPEPPRSSPYSHIPLPEEPVYEDFCEILQSALCTKILGFVVLAMAFLTTMYT